MIIGDGGFSESDRDAALIDINAMWNNFGIKTFTVAYGGGLGGTSLQRLDDLAAAGQTTESIIATTPASLKSQLQAQITEIIGKKGTIIKQKDRQKSNIPEKASGQASQEALGTVAQTENASARSKSNSGNKAPA